MIDVIKLLELYKASNFSSSSKADVEGRTRINKAIRKVYSLINKEKEYEQYRRFSSKLAKINLKTLKTKEWTKKLKITEENSK